MKNREKEVWYEVEREFTNHRSNDFKIIKKYDANLPEDWFEVKKYAFQDYKKEIGILNDEYSQLLIQMQVGKEPTAFVSLFLVEDGPHGYKRHQLFLNDSEEPLCDAQDIDFALSKDIRKQIIDKIKFKEEDYKKAHETKEILYYITYCYQVRWNSSDTSRGDTEVFLHHDLLYSRSRAINFLKEKAKIGHVCGLSLRRTNKQHPVHELFCSIKGWRKDIQEGRLDEYELLVSLGYEHPDPEYSQLIVPNQDFNGDGSDN